MCITGAPRCASTPPCLLHTPSTVQDIRPPSRIEPPTADRHPCVGTFRKTPARTPSRPLRKGVGALHGGLQAAVLVEDADIPPRMACSIRARSRRISSSISDGRGYRDQFVSTVLVLPYFLPSPDDRHHFDLEAEVPELLPQIAVFRAPRTERRRGVVARFGVDEDGALRVQRDGKPERKEAPEPPERAPVDPLGEEPRSIPSASKAATLSASVGSHGSPGMFEYVVEREQTAHHHFGRLDPSSAVVPGAELLIDPAPVDSADPADGREAGQCASNADPQLGGLGGGQGIRSRVRSGSDLAVVGLDKTIPLDPVPTDRVGADESSPIRTTLPGRGIVSASHGFGCGRSARVRRRSSGPAPNRTATDWTSGSTLSSRSSSRRHPSPWILRTPSRFIRLLLSARVRASLAEAHTKAAGGTSVQTGYFFHDFGAKRFPSGPGRSSRARAETSRRVGKKVPEIRPEMCQELPVRRDLPKTCRTNGRIRALKPVRRFSRSHRLFRRGHDPKGGSPEPRS